MPDHNDKDTWLWGKEVAKQLGCVRNTVLLMAKKGLLHPIVDAAGDNRYDPDEIFLLKYRRKASELDQPSSSFTAAKRRRAILVGLRAGMLPADLMIDYGASEEEILHLHEVNYATIQKLSGKKQTNELQTVMDQQELKSKQERAARLERLRAMLTPTPAKPAMPEEKPDGKRKRKLGSAR